MDVSDLKKNVKLLLNGNPFVVTEFTFVKPGKGQGLYKCKLKNLVSGAIMERTYRSGEKLEQADVETRGFQYLFASPDGYTFMDRENYEQIEVGSDVVGNNRNFLMDQLDVELLFFNGKVIDVTLPSHVVMEVTETGEGAKGDSATGATKPATLETGYEIQVPLFLKQGERVKIDTRTGEYCERVNS